MIFAEIHGKLGQHHSRAHERAEDLLTSTVFGLLRYLPLSDWMPELVRRIRPIDEERGPGFPMDRNWLDSSTVVRCRLEMWRGRRPHGEPDVLMSLFDDQERLRHLLVIEVKLYSPKSGTAKIVKRGADADDEEEQLADIDKDQLVRYWRYLCDERSQERAKQTGDSADAPPICASLVYLTAHATPPTDELLLSRRAGGPDMRLGWLSWFDMWQVVHHIAARDKALPAVDLATLLSHKGFRRFIGFTSKETTSGAWSSESPRFWQKRSWFRQKGSAPVEGAKFWKQAG